MKNEFKENKITIAAVLLGFGLFIFSGLRANGLEIYISLSGNDHNPGTKENPLTVCRGRSAK